MLDGQRAAKKLPGENFDENKQCELVFGTGSKICPYMVSASNATRRDLIHRDFYLARVSFLPIAALQATVVHDGRRRARGLPHSAHALG